MLEGAYQYELKKKIQRLFPDAIIIKTDDIQGFPDLLILHKYKWAALEVKRSENAPHRPNQDYWVRMLDDMSFAAFIYPENEGEILDELEQSLCS